MQIIYSWFVRLSQMKRRSKENPKAGRAEPAIKGAERAPCLTQLARGSERADVVVAARRRCGGASSRLARQASAGSASGPSPLY